MKSPILKEFVKQTGITKYTTYSDKRVSGTRFKILVTKNAKLHTTEWQSKLHEYSPNIKSIDVYEVQNAHSYWDIAISIQLNCKARDIITTKELFTIVDAKIEYKTPYTTNTGIIWEVGAKAKGDYELVIELDGRPLTDVVFLKLDEIKSLINNRITTFIRNESKQTIKIIE